MVSKMSRSALLRPKGPKPAKRTTGLPFPFNGDHSEVHQALEDSHPLLLFSPILSQLFPKTQSVIPVFSRNLKYVLCRTEFKLPTARCPLGCMRCSKQDCFLHQILGVGRQIVAFSTNEVLTIPGTISCDTQNVIYVVEGSRCSIQGVGQCYSPLERLGQYVRCARENRLDSASRGVAICQRFVSSYHEITDLHITLVDCIPQTANIPPALWSAIRTRLESRWIAKLHAGLHKRKQWRASFSGSAAARLVPHVSA